MFVDVGRPLWREGGSVICSAMTQVPFQVTLRPTVCRPVRLGAGPLYIHHEQQPKAKVKSQSYVSEGQKFLILPLGGLHGKHAVQRGIWVPIQHFLWDQGNPRKTLIELASCRTFRMQTDF
jgi:hypothetical protein